MSHVAIIYWFHLVLSVLRDIQIIFIIVEVLLVPFVLSSYRGSSRESSMLYRRQFKRPLNSESAHREREMTMLNRA